jgi:hypothetical protein
MQHVQVVATEKMVLAAENHVAPEPLIYIAAAQSASAEPDE